MRYPWVNTLLLVLIPAALVSGYLGLTNGHPGRAWILWVHAIVAYAIVAVAVWKIALVRRSLERKPLGPPSRPAFLLMGALLGFVLLSGIQWAWFGRVSFAGTSLMTLHGLAAAAVAAFFAWHVIESRSIFKVRRARDRRAFLRLAGAGVAGLGAWGAGLLTMRLFDLPGASRRFTGSYETGSMTGEFPAVSWLYDAPDSVSTSDWRLHVDGHVDTPGLFSYEELSGLQTGMSTAVLDCTGGWFSRQEWTGVPLSALLDRAGGLKAGAHSITVTGVTGYNRRFSLDEANASLLALAVAGQPLSDEHGFPARLVMPGHRGFDWVKWVTHVTVNEGGDEWQAPLPLG